MTHIVTSGTKKFTANWSTFSEWQECYIILFKSYSKWYHTNTSKFSYVIVNQQYQNKQIQGKVHDDLYQEIREKKS